MSTIHRPASLNLWWYVAVAVLAGAVLSLAVVVLQGGHHPTTNTPLLVPTGGHIDRPSHVCFAMPHYPTIELVRSGCFH